MGKLVWTKWYKWWHRTFTTYPISSAYCVLSTERDCVKINHKCEEFDTNKCPTPDSNKPVCE